MAGVVDSALIATLGLPTEHGRLEVRQDLQVSDMPDVYAGGGAAAVPDVTTPDHHFLDSQAHHPPRQSIGNQRRGQPRLRRAASLPSPRSRRSRLFRRGFAVANPLNIFALSGLAANVSTGSDHLYGDTSQRQAVGRTIAYLTSRCLPMHLRVAGSNAVLHCPDSRRVNGSHERRHPADSSLRTPLSHVLALWGTMIRMKPAIGVPETSRQRLIGSWPHGLCEVRSRP